MVMGTSALGPLSRALPEAAARAGTVAELGSVLSQQLGRVLPHDGYLLSGFDPVTGARCFLACENSYSSAARRRMDRANALGRTRRPVADLLHGPCPAVVLGAGAQDPGPETLRLHDLMAADDYGSELCIALSRRGVARGALVLLRERGSRPFSPEETVCAAELAQPLASAVTRYVTDKPLRPRQIHLPPAIVVINKNNEIAGATSAGRDALRGILPGVYPAADQELFSFIWHITYTVRRTGMPAITRAPTPLGWFSLQAHPLDGAMSGDVVVTLQPAPPAELLPALAQWYGITARERMVIEGALQGQAAKQIARRLDLSPHTVNDHFKAVYRKTGVTSREELIACL
ncbi:helix-turn-helix transcriptional regulator [Streptomyces sp. KL118A]|uniref:helix-turn-helix transcriptional regulator n=1 Tax=Streptomyces sp. KL118A TaxID=3045153 RepID=UPI00278C1389|nr:helix-turn-helix transcriptional regulator [Streptomyces sp. KL118A]